MIGIVITRFIGRVFAFALLAFPAFAQDRVALIIGNSAYQEVSPLRNPGNDARAVSEAFKQAGFVTTTVLDADSNAMRKAIREFGAQAEKSKVALLYYAGHAVQVDGRNYLIAVDSKIESASDLEFATIPMDLVVRTLSRSTGAKVLMLDACRNNPFKEQLSRNFSSSRSLLLSEGLAKIDAAQNTYIVFSTAPDQVAKDGTGQNSPFAEALVKQLALAIGDIQDLMRKVRRDVIASTNGTQTPWDQSSLIEDIVLRPGTSAPVQQLIDGIGPNFEGVRLGQSFSQINARFGEKLSFHAQYDNGVAYWIPLSGDDSMVGYFDNDDSLARISITYERSSRGTLERDVRAVLAPVGISLSDIHVTKLDDDAASWLPKDDETRLMELGFDRWGLLSKSRSESSDSVRCNTPPKPGDYNHADDCGFKAKAGSLGSFALEVSVRYLPKEAQASIVVERDDFQMGTLLYDQWRDHDIDIVHFAKRAIATQGPYQKFHGLYSLHACEPFDGVGKTADRLSKVAMWSEGNKLYLRGFAYPLGEFGEMEVLKERTKTTTIRGHRANLTILNVREQLEDGKIETFELVLVDQPDYSISVGSGAYRTEVPAGGRSMVIGGASLWKCTDDIAILPGSQRIRQSETVD